MREKEVRDRLLAAGIENAALEAAWLCEHFGGEVPTQAVERRAAHYPLQYILGEWEFCHERYEVSEHCLIPRADTELLVEQAAALLPQGARFLDLCTGSGCVAISTLCMRLDTTATAVDLFDETLALAKRNAERNGVASRVLFEKADVLLPPDERFSGGYQAVLANPPYITRAAMECLQAEVRHEPSAALFGGEDGLDFYRAILGNWQGVLLEGGFFLFEIGYDQGAALRALGEQYGYGCRVLRDLGGNDRVVALKKA